MKTINNSQLVQLGASGPFATLPYMLNQGLAAAFGHPCLPGYPAAPAAPVLLKGYARGQGRALPVS